MKHKKYFFPLTLLSLGLLLYLPLSSPDISFIWYLTKEDSVYENLGAVFFFLSSLIFFGSFIRSKKGNNFYFLTTKKNLFFLLLSLLFFIGFGEEISWGQRIFDLPVPTFFQKYNMQGEINIHNLKWFHRFSDQDQTQTKNFWQLFLNVGRLYVIFWFTLFLAIPILNKFNAKAHRFVQKINLPIVPVYVGCFFLINYIISNVLYQTIDHRKITPLMEIKETISSYYCLVIAIVFLWEQKKLSTKGY